MELCQWRLANRNSSAVPYAETFLELFQLSMGVEENEVKPNTYILFALMFCIGYWLWIPTVEQKVEEQKVEVVSPVVTLIRICVEGAFIVVNLDEWFFPLQQFWLMSLICISGQVHQAADQTAPCILLHLPFHVHQSTHTFCGLYAKKQGNATIVMLSWCRPLNPI